MAIKIKRLKSGVFAQVSTVPDTTTATLVDGQLGYERDSGNLKICDNNEIKDAVKRVQLANTANTANTADKALRLGTTGTPAPAKSIVLGDGTAPGQIGDIYKPIYVGTDGSLKASDGSVGESNSPIYLNKGILTRMSGPIGSDTNPLYVNQTGYITPSTANVGSSKVPMYMQNGVFKATMQSELRRGVFGDSAIGSANRPIYIAAGGVPTPATKIYDLIITSASQIPELETTSAQTVAIVSGLTYTKPIMVSSTVQHIYGLSSSYGGFTLYLENTAGILADGFFYANNAILHNMNIAYIHRGGGVAGKGVVVLFVRGVDSCYINVTLSETFFGTFHVIKGLGVSSSESPDFSFTNTNINITNAGRGSIIYGFYGAYGISSCFVTFVKAYTGLTGISWTGFGRCVQLRNCYVTLDADVSFDTQYPSSYLYGFNRCSIMYYCTVTRRVQSSSNMLIISPFTECTRNYLSQQVSDIV